MIRINPSIHPTHSMYRTVETEGLEWCESVECGCQCLGSIITNTVTYTHVECKRNVTIEYALNSTRMMQSYLASPATRVMCTWPAQPSHGPSPRHLKHTPPSLRVSNVHPFHHTIIASITEALQLSLEIHTRVWYTAVHWCHKPLPVCIVLLLWGGHGCGGADTITW